MRADRDSVYGVAGLRLQCPWPLPYLPYAERDGELDMRVIVSAGDPGEATAHDSWLTVTRSDAGYRISIGDLVTCDIDRNGTEIHLSASGALPTETLSHLLIDHILPLVLTLRGRHVVHASAV